MKAFQSLLPAFGLIAAVQAWANETYYTTTTVTTDIYTTYCPSSTTVVQGSKTYTVTEATTLTITDCPCTYTTTTTCPPPSSTPTSAAPPPPSSNATTTTPPPVWVTTTVSEYTTYCPSPTVISQGNKTWSITTPTTLTISECPCIISYPASSPIVTTTPISNGTTAATKTPVGPSATTSGPIFATGAAMRFEAGAGAIVAAGLAALFL